VHVPEVRGLSAPLWVFKMGAAFREPAPTGSLRLSGPASPCGRPGPAVEGCPLPTGGGAWNMPRPSL
jgi:hypothetical protein